MTAIPSRHRFTPRYPATALGAAERGLCMRCSKRPRALSLFCGDCLSQIRGEMGGRYGR